MSRPDTLGRFRLETGATQIAFAAPLLLAAAVAALLDFGSRSVSALPGMADLRAIALYNLSLSFVVSAPLCGYLLHRLAPGRSRETENQRAGAILLASGLSIAIVFPIAAVYHLLWAQFSGLMGTIAVAGAVLTALFWICLSALVALRAHTAIAVALAAGGIAALFLALVLAPRFGAPALASAYAAGFAIASGAMLGPILERFQGGLEAPKQTLRQFAQYPEIVLAALSFALAWWIDNWFMWGAPGAQAGPGGLVTMPSYDRAVFLAQLSMIPGAIVFLAALEPEFRGRLADLRRSVLEATVPGKAAEAEQETRVFALRTLGKFFVFQAALATIAVLASPGLISALGYHQAEASIFRYAVMGTAAHAALAIVLVWLAQLERRNAVLLIATVFLILNASLTLLTIELGPRWYGYGYFLAALGSLTLASVLLIRDLRRLAYLTMATSSDPSGDTIGQRGAGAS